MNEKLRRRGVATRVLNTIETWFKMNKIPIYGIYMLKDVAANSKKGGEMEQLFSKLGKDRMNVAAHKILGYHVENL